MATFELGQCVATPGALIAIDNSEETFEAYLARHASGDWGEVDEYDKQANDHAAQGDERILSAYTLKSGVRIWVVTEADRSVTTILLPEEY